MADPSERAGSARLISYDWRLRGGQDADLFHDGGEVVVVNAARDFAVGNGDDTDAADFERLSGLEDAFVGAAEDPLNAAVIAFD